MANSKPRLGELLWVGPADGRISNFGDIEFRRVSSDGEVRPLRFLFAVAQPLLLFSNKIPQISA